MRGVLGKLIYLGNPMYNIDPFPYVPAISLTPGSVVSVNFGEKGPLSFTFPLSTFCNVGTKYLFFGIILNSLSLECYPSYQAP